MRAIPVLLILSFIITACTSKKEKAEKHIAAVSKQHNLVLNKLNALHDACITGEDNLIDKTYIDAYRQLDTSLTKVQQLDTYPGEDHLIVEVEVLFDIYLSVLDNEYPIVIETLKAPPSPVSNQLLLNLQTRIFNRLNKAYAKYETAVAGYIDRYNITKKTDDAPFFLEEQYPKEIEKPDFSTPVTSSRMQESKELVQ